MGDRGGDENTNASRRATAYGIPLHMVSATASQKMLDGVEMTITYRRVGKMEPEDFIVSVGSPGEK